MWVSLLLDGLAALGTVVSAGALIVAVCQIADAKKTLRASTQYQIAKDHDELLASIPQPVWSRLESHPSGALDSETERHVIRILSFAATVVEQRNLDFVTPEFWESFRRGFCGFLAQPAVSTYWQQMVETGKRDFPTELIALKGKCKT
jgi:hypothetical protein